MHKDQAAALLNEELSHLDQTQKVKVHPRVVNMALLPYDYNDDDDDDDARHGDQNAKAEQATLEDRFCIEVKKTKSQGMAQPLCPDDDTDCFIPGDWQESNHRNCNSMHEIDLNKFF